MTIHELKIWPDVFDAVVSGKKTWEFRRDDRGFSEGDTVILHLFDPKNSGQQLDRILERKIGYMLRGPDFGIPEGYVIFTLLNP
jgi:hypothetical protein